MAKLTFAPTRRWLPGLGFCEMTRPLLTFEYFLVIVPGLQ